MNKTLLIVILSLGLALRLVGLDQRPAGFTWDEAAIGYNSYSLLKTGRDEYGSLFPVIFKSFGDFKPGLYIYFAVPTVKLFGLNEFSTRLPSAIFGTLLLAAIYVLTKILFPKKDFAGYSLFLAAVNPWLIHFSRGAWEANLNLLLITLALTLYLYTLHHKSYLLYLISFILFGLTFWAYQSAKLFSPLLLAALLVISFRRIKFTKLILPAMLMVAIILPVIINFSGQSGRLRVFSVFSYTRKFEDVSEILKQDNTDSKNLVYYLFHSEFLDQGRGVFQRYLNHLSPRFLFIDGDWTNLRHSLYKFGNFYIFDFLLIAAGLLYLLRYLLNSTAVKIIFFWLLIAPIPAALSRDLVSGVRSLPLAIPLIIISAVGLSSIRKFKPGFILYSLLMLFFFVYYLDMYYIHQPFYSAPEWVYPYRQAMIKVSDLQDKYSHIVITDKLGQPYIFTLFYLKVDPKSYQSQAKLQDNVFGDVGKVESFSKFSFTSIYWPKLKSQPNTLFIGDPYELPEKDLTGPSLQKYGNIYYPNGQMALTIVANP